jgi:glycosidase
MARKLKTISPVLAVAVLLLASCTMQPGPPGAVPDLGGRNEGTWYEIFTGSFYDSNGDGIGDLNGIAMKLDYLNDTNTARHRRELLRDRDGDGNADGICNESLHLDGIWLTPIMPSPSYHKYDTKDYKDIDPQFGTLADFKELLKKCHEHGIKLIIDLVMNHSSQDHPWFQKALEEVRSGNPGRYASYYNFYYGKTPPQHETVEYNTDYWGKRYISGRYFKQWGNAAPGVWWEGSFWTGMPDLNWDSQALREEFKDIVEFWLNAGLDGFRLDATSWPYDYYGLGQMEHRYDGINVDEKNIELWTWFTKTCQAVNENVYLVGECWKDEGTIANYYRSGMNYFAFQFHDNDLKKVNEAVKNNGRWWAYNVVDWERKIKARNPDAVSAIFLSNHDQGRSYYYFPDMGIGKDDARKMGAALYLLSPGTPFIYYGEEIGLIDFSDQEDSDHRGPMWWSNTDQYGTPSPPEKRDWPVKAPPSGKGVEEQLKDEHSLLRYYVKISNLKNEYPWLAYGYKIEDLGGLGDNAVGAFRVYNPDKPGPDGSYQSIVIAHNTDWGTERWFNYYTTSKFVPHAIHGFSARSNEWFPAIESNKEIRMPPYSTAIIVEYDERSDP